MYRLRILDHYRTPRNYGMMEDPTFTHVGENTCCGDELSVYVALDQEDRIERVSFTGQRCAISQAAASMFSEELEAVSLEEIHEFDREDILDLLSVDITPVRVIYAVLIEKAVQAGANIHEDELEIETTSTEE